MSYAILTRTLSGAVLAEFVDRTEDSLLFTKDGENMHERAALALLARHGITPLPTQKTTVAWPPVQRQYQWSAYLFVSLSPEVVDALEQGQNCVRVIIDSRMGDESDAAFMEAANRVLEPLHG